MQLKILGNYGPYACGQEACSSYLLRAGDMTFVLDMGSGSLPMLLDTVDMGSIDAVILSHLHFDHISDALVFQYALEQSGRNVKLFLPASPNVIASLFSEKQFQKTYLQDGMQEKLGGVTLTFARMTHPVESYAVKIQAEGKTFVYSGDTNYNDRIVPFVKKADLFLCDGCFPEKTVGGAHLSVPEIQEIAQAAEVKRTLITHFHPQKKYDMINGALEKSFRGELYEIE